MPDAGGRFDAVLRVLYLIFNEGYASTAGTSYCDWFLDARRHQ